MCKLGHGCHEFCGGCIKLEISHFQDCAEVAVTLGRLLSRLRASSIGFACSKLCLGCRLSDHCVRLHRTVLGLQYCLLPGVSPVFKALILAEEAVAAPPAAAEATRLLLFGDLTSEERP